MNSLSSKWVDFAILTCAFFLIVHDLDAPQHFFHPLQTQEYAEGVGRIGKQVGSILLLLYALFVLLTNRTRTFTLSTTSVKLACAFYAIVTISLVWSISPTVSLSRWFGLTTYILAAAAAVKRLGTINVVRWYVFAQVFYFIVGIGNELRLGVFQPFSQDYRFQGINDENNDGAEAAILLFASIAMLRSAPSSSRWYRASVVLAVFIMLLTKSRTALLSSIFTLILVYGVISFRSVKLGLYLSGLLILVSTFFVLDTLKLFSIGDVATVGREDARQDPTQDALNGRGPLWAELYQGYVDKRPLLGYGYGAFWTPNRIVDISADQDWDIAAAHSIYLDSLLAVGFFGAFLYVGTLLSLLADSAKFARRGKQEAFFFACVLCALLFDGLSDSGPWYIASMYLFASTQAVFVLCSVETQAIEVSPLPTASGRLLDSPRAGWAPGLNADEGHA